jgi:hypothetical protein
VASFDRAIPPGGEGKITLTVDTARYEGNIHKSAVIYTNDPKMARFSLQVRAFVQVPILIKPPYVRLKGKDDTRTTVSIEITAGLDKSLMLEPAQFSLEGEIDYRIEEIEEGRKFRVYFTNIPGVAGSYSGFLNLKTNYEEKSILNIRIKARLKKVITTR